jgi:hypothetical protein
MKPVDPSPNGRDAQGRFRPGWGGGPGNPHARAVGELRTALLTTVTADDISAIVRVLIEQAKAGEIRAIREVLDRTLGRPIEADLLERLAELETLAAEIAAGDSQ